MCACRTRSIDHQRVQRYPLFIQQTIERRPAFAKGYVCFSRIKKMLGRIETRTRDRIYCQTLRTVRDISRDDRAGIATCSLRTLTDRLKENYSIDFTTCIQTPMTGRVKTKRTSKTRWVHSIKHFDSLNTTIAVQMVPDRTLWKALKNRPPKLEHYILRRHNWPNHKAVIALGSFSNPELQFRLTVRQHLF